MNDKPTFSYELCRIGPDGRRRAQLADGREVTLVCDDAPNKKAPILGWINEAGSVHYWTKDGRHGISEFNLFLPPKPKKVVWVNIWKGLMFSSEKEADVAREKAPLGSILVDRAFPIEVDEGE